MWFVFAVAIDAGGGRLAIALAGLMAAAAREQLVGVVQREIAALMVELLGDEFDDVRVASLMLAMTAAALRLLSAGEAAVETAAGAQVLLHVLVTARAQCALTAAIAAVVTVGALALELRVRAGYLAGHEQRLDLGRLRGGCENERCGDVEQEAGDIGELPHPGRSSVDVDRDDMDDARDQQQEEQRQMQDVPPGEQAHIRLIIGDAPCRGRCA